MIIIGSFFDALYPEPQIKRMQLIEKFSESGFNYIGTSLNQGNESFIEKCKELGLMIGYLPNGGPDGWIKDMLASNDHIKTVYTQDDANKVTPDMVKERTDKFKALMRPDQKTVFSGAFHGINQSTGIDTWPNFQDFFGLNDGMGLQIYHWRWYWSRAFFERCKKATDASSTQEFWAHPTICRNYFDLTVSPWVATHPTLNVQDYPSIEWIKMYVFSALIAGINNIVFYTAYYADPNKNWFETTNLMKQPLINELKELTTFVKKYSDFFEKGKRILTIESQNSIGAEWTLDGKTIKININNLQPDPKNNNVAPDMTMIPQFDIILPNEDTLPSPTPNPPTIKPITIIIPEKTINVVIPSQLITVEI